MRSDAISRDVISPGEKSPDGNGNQPLVSIICFCRNRVSTIRRCIESVLGQSYQNIEFVVQDGASTDGTLEILREYADRDSRVKLISAPDSGPAEAFWKVLQRCQGEIIATCLSDEELLPNVLELAVEQFRTQPGLGALTCDGYITDESGKITGDFKAGDFDFVGYLFSNYCPFWPGSFFRRQALIDVGFLDVGWNLDCIEFEIWCRLAADHDVEYLPKPMSKYAVHPTQASNTPANFHEHLDGRLKLIEKMFSSDGFFGPDEFMKIECMINQVFLFYNHARAYRLTEQETFFAAKIAELESSRDRLGVLSQPYWIGFSAAAKASIESRIGRVLQYSKRAIPAALRKLVPLRIKLFVLRKIEVASTVLATGQLPSQIMRATESRAHHRWALAAVRVPGRIRTLLPRPVKIAARRMVFQAAILVRYFPLFPFWLVWRFTRTKANEPRSIVAPERHRSLSVYPRAAQIYDSRGQIKQALDMWRRAEELNNSTIDSLACQAILKLPEANYEEIAKLQQRWADKHAQPIASRTEHRFLPYDNRRKLKIGYHCSFMESDTIRYIMRNVIAAHDRSSFEIYGYSPGALSADIRSAFDVVRDTAFLGVNEFIDTVRGDNIDVFIELTGLSPGHRYVEMASRCAPVQVSYLNHHGTSRVVAVDYFLSDEMSTPLGSAADTTFSERIHRMPNCLLCYDYEGYPHPPVVDPPSRLNQTVTFGCFGSGSKINLELIGMWAALLHRVPGSIFYIRNTQLGDAESQRYMASRFRRFGIGPERLRLAGGTDRQSLLRCYDEVDVSLDTWPYCGGNTVAEALWQGVPVVSLKGDRISSRYGASLLTAAGCADFVASNADEYVEIAARLVEDRDKLLLLRHNLRKMCKENGLGNSEQFARDLESFYQYAMTG
jgi:predicted O-linked N-acetylglucosamine transferase (SPINDLY family)/glycosyltransferase involved in cell wall biosynthesis